MPVQRFYFHFENGEVVRDRDGELLPGPEAARKVAVEIMAESLIGQGQRLFADDFRVTCTDAEGLILFVVIATAAASAAA